MQNCSTYSAERQPKANIPNGNASVFMHHRNNGIASEARRGAARAGAGGGAAGGGGGGGGGGLVKFLLAPIIGRHEGQAGHARGGRRGRRPRAAGGHGITRWWREVV